MARKSVDRFSYLSPALRTPMSLADRAYGGYTCAWSSNQNCIYPERVHRIDSAACYAGRYSKLLRVATGWLRWRYSKIRGGRGERTVQCPIQLPKDALEKASVGQSFAEYDLIRAHPSLFVETPASRAALDPNRPKSFFVGRRGTGKTAITFYLQSKNSKNTLLLIPQLLAAADEYIQTDWSPDVHQQPFKTLVCSFKRAILDEVLAVWFKQGLYRFRSTTAITRERNDVSSTTSVSGC